MAARGARLPAAGPWCAAGDQVTAAAAPAPRPRCHRSRRMCDVREPAVLEGRCRHMICRSRAAAAEKQPPASECRNAICGSIKIQHVMFHSAVECDVLFDLDGVVVFEQALSHLLLISLFIVCRHLQSLLLFSLETLFGIEYHHYSIFQNVNAASKDPSVNYVSYILPHLFPRYRF